MELMKLLPDYYEDNETMKLLQSLLSSETDALSDTLDLAVKNSIPSSAVGDGIVRIEKILGITSNAELSEAARKENINAKLSGVRTTTVEMIKDIASRFSNGEVEVVDEPNLYQFTVRFVGSIGIPENMDGLKKAIDEIKPAHLLCLYEYIYNIHRSLKRFTHKDLALKKHLELRNEVLHG